MKLQRISAALFSLAFVAGCGDRGAQNPQNSDQTVVAPAESTAVDQSAERGRDQVSPNADISASRDSSGARPTTGSTTSGSRPTAQAHHSTVERPAPAPRDFDTRTGNAAAPASAPSRAPAVPTFHEVTVPAGTSLSLELLTALSSETAHVESPVRARLRNSVSVDGYTAIPAGTVFDGTVTDVEEAGRVRGRAKLTFRFDEAMVNGVRENLRTNPLTFQAEATKGEDATKIGAGAGIGAAIGGIIGGGKGAAKGAAIGGAAGTGAVLATKGKDVTLAEGTDLSASLADSVTVRAK